MAVIDDVHALLPNELLDELDPQPILDHGVAHDCVACGAEGTYTHPVFKLRIRDYDGSVFERMCVECLAGLAAHHRRGL
jgi:hypothetical protein